MLEDLNANAPPIGRRGLLSAVTASFAAYALLHETRVAGAIPAARLTARRWIDRQDELARALAAGSLSQIAWHDKVNRLAAEVDIAQLIAETRRGRIGEAGSPFGHDPVKRSVRFVDDDGMPRKFRYAAAIFAFDAKSVITPHAHRHMASAHMVIEGKVRIRTFDRLHDRDGAIVIRPTADHIASVGSAAAMTSQKDNIHWFVPASARAMTFDVIVDNLDPGENSYVIEPIDPIGGVRQADGSIVAPILTFEESMARYSSRI